MLQIFGGRLEKISLQKLLFLVCNKQKEPRYEFIPYLYGCYSYSANADLFTMVKKGLLSEDDSSYVKGERTDYLSMLDEEDRKFVQDTYKKFYQADKESLMLHTYIHFPYYAINSKVAGSLLDPDQLDKIESVRPIEKTITLYTIGYEGVSLEAYLNKLIKHYIHVLVDVRNNPLSQKFGFSKNQLKRYCEGLHIEYLHFADVGIQAEFRQELKNQDDYDRLFAVYKSKTLSETISTQKKILDLLKENRRIALTCFEANICQCHRTHLAEAISRLPGWDYELKHI